MIDYTPNTHTHTGGKCAALVRARSTGVKYLLDLERAHFCRIHMDVMANNRFADCQPGPEKMIVFDVLSDRFVSELFNASCGDSMFDMKKFHIVTYL